MSWPEAVALSVLFASGAAIIWAFAWSVKR